MLNETEEVSAVNCALCQNRTSKRGEKALKLAVMGNGLGGSVAGAGAGLADEEGAGVAGATGAPELLTGTTDGLLKPAGGDGFNCSLPGLIDAAILSSKLTGCNKDVEVEML